MSDKTEPTPPVLYALWSPEHGYIWRFEMSHKLHKCNDERCSICEGGLAYCETCKGGECDLPTDCPGHPMSDEKLRSVRLGKLDFVNGKWQEVRGE